jgi:hypothetical protein
MQDSRRPADGAVLDYRLECLDLAQTEMASHA